MRKKMLVSLILGWACLFTAQSIMAKNVFDWRMVWYRSALDKTEKVNEMLKDMERASRAGYNAFAHEYNYEKYQDSALLKAKDALSRINSKAKSLNMTMIPSSLGQWEAARMDTSLAEAFPVVGTPFKVKGKTATISAAAPGLPSDPTTWSRSNSSCTVDPGHKKSGNASIRMTNPPAHTEISTQVNLKPNRGYELSVWIKTADYSGYLRPSFRVKAGGRAILNRRDRCFMTPKSWSLVGKTMDWKLCKIDFNSLEATSVTIALNTGRKAATGKIWFDDILIREVGLYETHRGHPVIVKSATGKEYAQGTDFVVGPEKLIIPEGSSIRNGEMLAVTWYQHANVETMVAATDYCNPKSWAMTEKIASDVLELYDQPGAYFVGLDEWRVAFWNPQGPSLYGNAAQYMGDVLKKKAQILMATNSNREIMVWNDMYDPYHNARNPYWMVNGPTSQAWKTIPNNTIIVNWNGHNRKQGMDFFAGLDPKYPKVFFRQILSINEAGVENWLKDLASMEATGKLSDDAVVGVQYCTWYHNYSNLENLAKACDRAGRWGKGPIPVKPARLAESGVQQKTSPNTIALKCNANGRVRYHLPSAFRHAELTLFDAGGKTVMRQIVRQQAGTHHLIGSANKLAAGVYCVRLSVDDGNGKCHAAVEKFVNPW